MQQFPGPPLVPLPFLEAIAWALARGVVLPDVYYDELQGLARAMAFSIAGITKVSQLQAVKDLLDANIASGGSFSEWKKLVKSGKVNLNLPDHRLENIFRTNIQGNYNRGRCEQQRGANETHPWRMYDAVNDSRTRPAHSAMDGFVARHDDPVWKKWQAPNGYQCFLPGTRVHGDFQIGLKAWYSGGAVEVITTHGNRLPVTANHPILTRDGWVKAGQLKEGDDLLGYQCLADDGIGSLVFGPDGSPGKIDDEQIPPTVEQVFDALAAQRFGRADRAAFNLYGDALNFKGQVQVVGAESELMDGVCSDGVKRIKDGYLNSGNHTAFGPWDEQLNTAGAPFPAAWLKVMAQVFQPFLDKWFRHADGVGNFFATVTALKLLRQLAVKVRNATLFAAFPCRLTLALNRLAIFLHHAPFQRFSLALAAQNDALSHQPGPDSLPACSNVVGYGLEAFTTGISGDQEGRIFRGPPGVFHGPAELDSERLLQRATFNPVVAQYSVEHAVTDAALFEQLAHGCPGLIKRNKVVGVRHFAFSGHVYDFQTANGLISANGIVTSNCRCRIIALTDKQAARFQAADAKRLSEDPELAAARATAQPDKGWDYSVCQDPDEGLRRGMERLRETADPRLVDAMEREAQD